MRAALERSGNPHLRVPTIHVAGTNGKGSVCAMLDSALRAAGLRVGLYTSPHLCRVNERIRIAGADISDADLETRLAAVLQREPDLSFFEVLTLIAFEAFAEASLDVVILETGLGGRLDATNVVDKPLATAITGVALDHQQYLGDTLTAIAREKAGICKAGVPLLLGAMPAEAQAAITDYAHQVGSAEARVSNAQELREAAELPLSLAGAHQRRNAALALAVLNVVGPLLLGHRWPMLSASATLGVGAAQWPGRMEKLQWRSRQIILDGAHNPDGASALRAALADEGLSPQNCVLLFGAMADKDWPALLDRLAPLASIRHYVPPSGRLATAPQDLSIRWPGHTHASVMDGLHAALQPLPGEGPNPTVLIAGSLYLVGECRARLLSPNLEAEHLDLSVGL